MTSMERRLDAYAELVVRTGVNLQSGQTLFIQSSISAADFVHRVMRFAYQAGASYVHVDWQDETGTRIWYEMAPEEELAKRPDWMVRVYNQLLGQNAAFLYVLSPFLEDMDGIAPNRLDLGSDALYAATADVTNRLMNNEASWTVMAVATKPWADKVFPEITEDKRMERLWETLFDSLGLNQENPLSVWEKRMTALAEKAAMLNKESFRFLHYKGSGIDLAIELPVSHRWLSGRLENKQGVFFTGNLPTEELYTTPLKRGVNGFFKGTKPFTFEGKVVTDFSLTFKNGEVVGIESGDGADELRRMLQFDEGARFAGEVALVPVHSPVARSGRLFYQPLLDENVSCHIALGHSYSSALAAGQELTAQEREEAGINSSGVHYDLMVGSETLFVTGERWDGTMVPIFEKGDWANTFKGEDER